MECNERDVTEMNNLPFQIESCVWARLWIPLDAVTWILNLGRHLLLYCRCLILNPKNAQMPMRSSPGRESLHLLNWISGNWDRMASSSIPYQRAYKNPEVVYLEWEEPFLGVEITFPVLYLSIGSWSLLSLDIWAWTTPLCMCSKLFIFTPLFSLKGPKLAPPK